MGGLHLGESSLAPSVACSLGPGMLLLVDQGLCSLELWRTLQATGAELVWRCRQDVKLPVLEVFADGSWASELGASQPKHQRVAVRVVDYCLDDPGRKSEAESYRLRPRSPTLSARPPPSCRRCIRSGGSTRPRWMS
jgi:hypothetical protein